MRQQRYFPSFLELPKAITSSKRTLVSTIFLVIGMLLSFNTYAQIPTNDECVNAIAITINDDNSSTINYNGQLNYASQSLPSCLSLSYPAKDIWYKFKATKTVHTITLTPTSSNDYVFEVFKGDCGNLTSIRCVNETQLEEIEAATIQDLIPGETYYIRIYNVYGDATPSRTFNLSINSSATTISNDDCSGAITVPITGRGEGKKYTNTGATLSMPACSGTATSDIWFKFKATGTRHRIFADANYGNNPLVIEVFKGDCTNLTSIKCYDYPNQLVDLTGLTPGNTYYYRIYFGNGSTLRTNIYTEVSAPDAPPQNDECSGAYLLPVNNNNSSTLTYSGSLQFASESMPSCVAYRAEANDTWYKFVATAATHNITLTPTSYNDFAFEVFKGNCGSLVSIACVNKTGSNELEAAVANQLNIGDTYFIRVYNVLGDATPSRTFNLCINTNSSEIPNDECSGAINVPITARGDGKKYTNIGATLSLPACVGTADNDTWFKFKATKARHRIFASADAGNDPITIQVFKGDCSNLTSILCYNYPSQLADLNNLTPGETYFYRIYFSNGSSLRTNIYTEVSAPDPPPANDECSGAIPLPVNNDNSTKLSYNGSLNYASQSLPACINYGYEANDTWYKFVATSTSHNIILTPLSYDDYVFEVFKGDCNAYTALDCTNNTGLNEKEAAVVNNLTIGATYFIRVYNRYGDATPSRNFNLCVNSSNRTIPNDECSGAINIPIGTNDTKYSNTGATLSMPACSGTANNDIWFKFRATNTRHQIEAHPMSGDLPVFIQVFRGECSNLTSIACYDYANEIADVTGLNPGDIYYYRIYISNGSPLNTDFTTAVTTPMRAPDAPVLTGNSIQCSSDTLKINVSGIDITNTLKGYLNGTLMSYDAGRKLLWQYPNSTGNYTITAVQINAQGQSSETATINITTAAPVTLNATLTSNTTRICEGSPLNLAVTIINGGPSPAFRWEVNGTSRWSGVNTVTSSTFKDGDQIAVIVTSDADCVMNPTITTNTITVKVDPVAIPAATIHVPSRLCASADYNVIVSPSGTPSNTTVQLQEITGTQAPQIIGTQIFNGSPLSWNIGHTNTGAIKKYVAQITPPADLVCAHRITTDTTTIIIDELPGTPEILLQNNLLKVSNYDHAANYTWQFKSTTSVWSDMENSSKQFLEPYKVGNYRVISTNGACIAVSNEILVSNKVPAVLYPVPAHDRIYLSPLFDTDKWEMLEIIGPTGKKLISENITGKPRVEINISRLPPAVYILQLRSSANNKLTRKFIKQ